MTIKHIFILRHGHSIFDASSDFKRVLTEQGKQAVVHSGNFIKKQIKQASLTQPVCISSSAQRTKQTTQIIGKINAIEKFDYYKELYSTSVSSWLEIVTKTQQQCLILVGHNPTFSQMVNVLTGKEFYMQPANCAFITLEIKADGFVYPACLNEIHANE